MGEKTGKILVGWQIVNAEGWNIHGDENDPFDMSSYDVLKGSAVETAREWCAENPGYKVIEVYDGDVDEPNFVESLETPPPTAP